MTEPLIIDVQAFERALRNVLSDEELTKRFWARGYEVEAIEWPA